MLMIFRRVHVGLVAVILAGTGIVAVQAQQNPGAAAASSYRNMLNQYCVSCHNETLKTANLMLDQANIDDLSQNPALWEKVITKLSLRAMPPVGFPVRPKDNEYQALLNYLVNGLDTLAANDINPGKPTIHRLNRTEYTNAIRDLLDLQIDGTAFLPADNVEEGFDNIADALAVSPLLMEQYMLAAGKVSRMAVGPAEMLPASETYTMPDGYKQDTRISEDLPFGSRGGTSIRHFFPMDGEYTIRVRLDRNMEGYIRGMQKKNLLDVRVDHKRVKLFTIGGERLGRSGPMFTDSQNVDFAGDDEQVGYEFSADKDLEVRIPVKAGNRLIGVTFLDDSGTKEEDFAIPEMTIRDISGYKGGNPTVLNVIVTGPYDPKGSGETTSRNKIFSCRPANEAEQACPESILGRLSRLAYRRAVTENELASLMRLYRKGRDDGGFEAGIELALQGILAGPEFLFRVEKDPEGAVAGKAHPVSDIELASRLSFFLWSSIPDEELLAAAEAGRLRDAKVLREQVTRMMADGRFQAMLDNFGGQWLAVRNVDIVAPQAEIFPEFDGELRVAMKQEMKLWFEDMVRNDRSVLDMLTSDRTFVNERLAKHYGIEGIYGDNFRPVKLDNPLRHGMLGKAGLLTITSFNNRTSPVVRGNWVLENMFAMAPPPPPADAFQPELKLEDKGRVLTMKESMEAHRTNPVCANCHKMMEPIGLALETFDAIGTYRTRYREANADVDASGILFDGSPFDDTAGFQKELFKHSERFVHTVTLKMLTYALGRAPQYYDMPTVRKIVREAKDDNYTWSSLILGIIESTPFQNRRS